MFLKKLGGVGNEFSPHLIRDGDKIYIAGNTNRSFGESTDAVIFRMDFSGKFLDSVALGGASKDIYGSIGISPSHSVLVLGSQSYFNSPISAFLSGTNKLRPIILGLDSELNILWAKDCRLNGGYEYTSIFSYQGNNYLLGNDSQGYLFFVKINDEGEVFFQKKYFFGMGRKMLRLSSGDFLVSGWTSVEKKMCMFGAVLSEKGELKSTFCYSVNGAVSLYSLVMGPNGAAYGLGGLKEDSGKVGNVLVKFRQDGSVEWGRLLTSSHEVVLFSIAPFSDTEFLLSGSFKNHGPKSSTVDEGIHVIIDLKGNVKSMHPYKFGERSVITESIASTSNVYFVGTVNSALNDSSDIIFGGISRKNLLNNFFNSFFVGSEEIILKEQKININEANIKLDMSDLLVKNVGRLKLKEVDCVH